jgi:hypothetical protein
MNEHLRWQRSPISINAQVLPLPVYFLPEQQFSSYVSHKWLANCQPTIMYFSVQQQEERFYILVSCSGTDVAIESNT